MRRSGALVLGIVYLLQAGWILQGGVDLLFPRSRVVTAGESTCCTSGCGCPAEAQKRKTCCCFPKKEAPQTAPGQVPVSSFEEDHCRGVGGAIALLSAQPAILGIVGWSPAVEHSAPVDIANHRPSLPFFDRSREKVPI